MHTFCPFIRPAPSACMQGKLFSLSFRLACCDSFNLMHMSIYPFTGYVETSDLFISAFMQHLAG